MYVKAEQLSAAVGKKLAPVYLLSGDEPLQLGEAADDIRRAARVAGFAEREVLSMQEGGSWHALQQAAESMSIFADNKIIDLRLPTAKPGTEGGKVLTAYCQHPPEHVLLLITTGKLEAATKKSQWLQAIDAVGVIVQVWPLQDSELESWLQRRAGKRGMQLDTDALKLLKSRVEGNLLAAAQDIEKLYIQHGAVTITQAMIEAEVADSARYDVFKLVDAALSGNLVRTLRILNGLQADNIPAPVVLWALSRELRALFSLKKQFSKLDARDKRHALLQKALQRLKADDLLYMLELCAYADLQVKGQRAGDAWESLFRICAQLIKPEQRQTFAVWY